jgi:hypothetical protein
VCRQVSAAGKTGLFRCRREEAPFLWVVRLSTHVADCARARLFLRLVAFMP